MCGSAAACGSGRMTPRLSREKSGNREGTMGLRLLASVGVLATVIAGVSLASVPLVGQAQTATADTWTPLRTSWGEPDLQGIWDLWKFAFQLDF